MHQSASDRCCVSCAIGVMSHNFDIIVCVNVFGILYCLLRCVKCDKLSKNSPLLYLHIQVSNSGTAMHFAVLMTASSDSQTIWQDSWALTYLL